MRRRSTLILSWNGKAAVARGRYPRHDGLHIRSRHVPWPHTRINRRRATLTERPEYFEFREGASWRSRSDLTNVALPAIPNVGLQLRREI